MSGPDGHPAALFGFVPARSAGAPTVTRSAVIAQLVDMFGPLAGDPIDVVWICFVSIFVMFSNGAGRVNWMPGWTVRAYLPSCMTTPSCSGPIRWMLVQTSHSARKAQMMRGNQLLPLGRLGKPPNPAPFPRSISSSEGPRPRVRAAGSGVGSHGLTGSCFDSPPRPLGSLVVPLSVGSDESHGPLPFVAKITVP